MKRFFKSHFTVCAVSRVTVLTFLITTAVEVGAATNAVVTDNVQATLISEVAAVKPGSAFWVGLHLKLRPQWHTYWSNPGDSGLAPRIEWRLPEGVVAGAINYPLPRRFRSGPLVNYGYDKEVVLLTRMSALPAVAGQRELTLHARARWLVCEKICIPEEGEFKVSLPVSTEVPAVDAQAKPLIQRFVASVPKSILDARFNATAERLQLKIHLQDKDSNDIKEIWFYPTEYGVVDHAADQPWRRVGRDVELSLARGELKGQTLKRLEGVLAIAYANETEHGYWIDALLR